MPSQSIVHVEVSSLGPGFEGLSKNIRYGVALGLNRTADELQAALRDGIRKRFHVRSERYILNMVKRRREDFAQRDGPLVARVRIEGPRSAKKGYQGAGVLTRHEAPPPALDANPTVFPGYFYIPTDATRPTPETVIPRAMYPSALGLAEVRTVEGGHVVRAAVTAAKLRAKKKLKPGAVQWKGKRRTFILPVAGEGAQQHFYAIYQREGPKRDDIQMIWLFKSRIRMRPRLMWRDTSERIAREQLSANISGMYKWALRSSADIAAMMQRAKGG